MSYDMIAARTKFRRQLLASDFVLHQCRELLCQAANKERRFDSVFELSQRETERIASIRSVLDKTIAKIDRHLATDINIDKRATAKVSAAARKLTRLTDLIESIDIRICHFERWFKELNVAVGERQIAAAPRNQLTSNKRILTAAQKHHTTFHDWQHEIAKGALKLVVSIAKRYANSRLPLMDLIQEGNCGLMTAVEKYKPELGFAFTTYATSWIQQKVLIAVFEKSRTVRLPIVLSRKLADTERDLELMTHSNAKRPNWEDSQEVAKRRKVVERLLPIYRNSFISIHGLTSAKGDQDKTFQLENKSIEPPVKSLHRQRVIEDVQRAVQKLEPQKRKAMELRFGLYGEPCSNRLIGDQLGISRETVRMLVKESIETLKGDLDHLGELAIA